MPPLVTDPKDLEDISGSPPRMAGVPIKTQINYWLEETSWGLSTIYRVDNWLERQTLFELIDPEKISSFLKKHQEILWELNTVARELFSAFTDDAGRKPKLCLDYWLDSSEDGRFSEEFLVVEVWVRMDPKEAFRRRKLFNRWWLEQPLWLRHPIVIDVSFERHE